MYIHITISMNSHSYEKKIVDYVKKIRVATSSDVAKLLNVSWNTADKYLIELMAVGKLIRIKKEGVNLWLIK